MLVLLFVALWFILRGDLFYVLPCVILFLCFSILLALRLPLLRKRELILVLFVRLFDLCLFGFVGFLFLLVSGKGSVCDCDTPWTFLLLFFAFQLVYPKLYFLKTIHQLKHQIKHQTHFSRITLWPNVFHCLCMFFCRTVLQVHSVNRL